MVFLSRYDYRIQKHKQLQLVPSPLYCAAVLNYCHATSSLATVSSILCYMDTSCLCYSEACIEQELSKHRQNSYLIPLVKQHFTLGGTLRQNHYSQFVNFIIDQHAYKDVADWLITGQYLDFKTANKLLLHLCSLNEGINLALLFSSSLKRQEGEVLLHESTYNVLLDHLIQQYQDHVALQLVCDNVLRDATDEKVIGKAIACLILFHHQFAIPIDLVQSYGVYTFSRKTLQNLMRALIITHQISFAWKVLERATTLGIFNPFLFHYYKDLLSVVVK